MNTIEQYLQAQSQEQKHSPASYYSYQHEDLEAYADGIASLVLCGLGMNTRDELLDEALGPQNVPERSTACKLFNQYVFGNKSADG